MRINAVSILTVAAVVSMAQPAAQPRLWDDAELTRMTLPAVLPEGRIVYLPAEAYYKQKPLVIYKSYPVYAPGREPEGYFDWLRRQEPEIAFDPAKLKTESDWRDAGQTVFEAPTDFAPVDSIHDREWFAKVKPPVTSEGVLPAYSYAIRKKGLVELGSGSCATCHSRVLPDGSYLPGAQGDFPIERAYAETLRRRKGAAEPRLTAGLLMSPADIARWTDRLYERSKQDIIAVFEAMIPGVAMRNGFSYLDPPKIADLIGVRDRQYLDMTARLIHRSADDVARYGSMCWASNYFFSADSALPESATKSVSDGMRYTDEQARAFAAYVYSLTPPKNPYRRTTLAKKGEAIFAREGCPQCHTPPLYTNNKIIPAGDFNPPADHRQRFSVQDVRVGTDSTAALKSLRGRGYYKVPSLKGVWYRGPFVHNGTIANLEDWFDPNRVRADYVATGYLGYGVRTRPVPGHPFGLSLNAVDRAALVAFLNTL